MKRLFAVLCLLLVFGCGDESTTTTTTTGTTTPTADDFNKTGTLQGKIMNALTGAALGGSDLQIFLVQGTQHRGPDRLITDLNSVLAGEYAFANIPVALSSANIVYKVVAVKNSFQRFEGELTIAAAGGGTDDTYNMIGNIYLFPLNAVSGDVSVFVLSPQGLPVPGATVRLTQNINLSNVLATSTSPTHRLGATNSLMASLSATTDAQGKATFAGSNLTLGGNYSVQVEPITFQGQQLAFFNPDLTTSFFVGIDSSTRTATLSNLDNVLFAHNASNQVPGTITPSGTLSVTFNQPIILSTTTFTASISSGSLASPSVTAQLSNGDATLTLTPSISTFPTAAGAAFITYSYAGTIFLKNSQTPTSFTLFGGINPVRNITTGANVSGVVQIKSN
ncbi:MAG TPA: hypothetical protein VEA16_20405 [Vicinamibacterales bacterium]|nr:hypothetical protein [Vicinamibacterales bacterium]